MSLRVPALLIGISAFLSCGSRAITESPQSEWISPAYASAHFSLHYQQLDRATIAQTAAAMEAEYSRIVDDLGGVESPRVDIWLYADHAALERALTPLIGTFPSWAAGAASRRDRIHMMSPNAPAWQPYSRMITNLVHEFAHCVSLQRNGTIGNNPRWLWESVAIYEAGQFRDPKSLAYMTALTPPSLASLSSFDNTRVYEVGFTIGEFIVTRWGKPALVTLIGNNGDIQATLGISQAQFEADWFTFVRQKYLF